jgi:hypothetical protein
MLLSLLTTSTKTGAANSSITPVSSYGMVCQNSENNLNDIHHGKKPNIHCAYHNLWGTGSRVSLNLDLGTRPRHIPQLLYYSRKNTLTHDPIE